MKLQVIIIEDDATSDVKKATRLLLSRKPLVEVEENQK